MNIFKKLNSMNDLHSFISECSVLSLNRKLFIVKYSSRTKHSSDWLSSISKSLQDFFASQKLDESCSFILVPEDLNFEQMNIEQAKVLHKKLTEFIEQEENIVK